MGIPRLWLKDREVMRVVDSDQIRCALNDVVSADPFDTGLVMTVHYMGVGGYHHAFWLESDVEA
jgi:hypothetical protein